MHTYRTVRTAGVIMLLIEWRMQRRWKMNGRQVGQRSCIISDWYLHWIVVSRWINTVGKNKIKPVKHTNLWWQLFYFMSYLIPGSLGNPHDDLGRLSFKLNTKLLPWSFANDLISILLLCIRRWATGLVGIGEWDPWLWWLSFKNGFREYIFLIVAWAISKAGIENN